MTLYEELSRLPSFEPKCSVENLDMTDSLFKQQRSSLNQNCFEAPKTIFKYIAMDFYIFVGRESVFFFSPRITFHWYDMYLLFYWYSQCITHLYHACKHYNHLNHKERLLTYIQKAGFQKPQIILKIFQK